jgi:hypothetical protein
VTTASIDRPTPPKTADTEPVSTIARDTAVVRIDELRDYDKITACTNLGPFVTVDDLTVKSAKPADRGKYAVQFFNIGTLFLPQTALVTILDKGDGR